MPWKEYCDLVLRHLPTPTGMSTLNFLLTFPRQAGWDILEWCERIDDCAAALAKYFP